MAASPSPSAAARAAILGGGGSGGHKASKWFKLAGLALAVALAAITSGGLGPFLVLVVIGGLIILDCIKHPAHIIRYVGAMVLIVGALMRNSITAKPMQSTADGVVSIGPTAVDAGQGWWNERNLTVNTGPAPVTTVPPAPAGPPVVQAAATR